MKKIIVSIMLVLALSSPALAVVQFIVPFWALLNASAIYHVIGATAGLVYSMTNERASVSDIVSEITKPSKVEWIDLTMSPPTKVTKPVTAKMPVSKFIELAKKTEGTTKTYPNSNSFIMGSGSSSPSGNTNVGDVISTPSGSLLVSDKMSVITPNNVLKAGTSVFDPSSVAVYGALDSGGSGQMTLTILFLGAPAVSVPVEKTPTEILTALRAPSGMDSVDSEISKMLKDSSYIPVFTDDMLGGVFVPPPLQDVMTPNQLDYYNTYGTVVPAAVADAVATANGSSASSSAAAAAAALSNTAAGAAAVAAQAAAATANANALAAAQNAQAATAAAATAQAAATAAAGSGNAAAASAAQSAADAAAGRADIAQGYAALTAAIAAGANSAAAGAAAAGAAAGSAAAGAAADAAKEEKNNNATAIGLPAKPAKKELDLEPLKQLKGALDSTYPFNLPQSISSYFNTFAGVGSAPVFHLYMPYGNTIDIDLSPFDPVATLCRYMFGVITSCGVMFYVVHFFRGVS